MSANLASILLDSASRRGDATALRLDNAEVSYSTLDGASAHVAGLLKEKGVQPGDRVGVMLPNVPYFAVVYYGVLRAGAVVVPMNVLLKGREVAFYCGDPESKVVFAWGDFAEGAQAGAEQAGSECILVKPGEFEDMVGAAPAETEVVDRDEDDTAVILYTSGTTGTPKGAELTHGNLRRNAQIVTELFGLGEGAVTLGALPLFHSFGQTCCMNATIGAGGCMTLIPRFDPAKALEIIERDKVNVFQGVPTMYAAMLNLPGADSYDTSSLDICVSGGAAMPVEIMRGFEEKFGCKVLEGYGLSETSPVASFNHPDRERKPGSIGTPIEGVEMKLADEKNGVGEIAIRGHNVMKGYWRNPEATQDVMRDGWFHTGDMAQVDDDGYFFIVDRKKDMIIRGGYNVYPREVEEIVYQHPSVLEAVVVGVPDERLGEEVVAVVVPRPGVSCDPDEVREFVRERIAAYKYPRLVVVTDALPRGPSGKILKREIDRGALRDALLETRRVDAR
jgi:long-chain acyl-CoA synthetase